MILVLNSITENKDRVLFSEKVFPKLDFQNYEERHLTESNIDTSKYSGLVISGSSLSSAKGSPLDKNLYRILDGFLKKSKPILGICWGHQMLAKYLGGDDYVRKAITPEFGWRRIEIIEDDKIFKGISNPICTQTHFDEVCIIRDDWQVLARSDECEYQAIRFGQKPIWGVQFHPEAFFEIGEYMITNSQKDYPETKPYQRSELSSKSQLAQNIKIFHNFQNAVKKYYIK